MGHARPHLSPTRMGLTTLALGLALSAEFAPAQSRGGGTTGGRPGAGSIPSPTVRTTTPTPTSRPGQQQPQGQPGGRILFLSGKVMLDDGTAPPETVVIERVCGASHRPEAYTDTKGRFSFQLGQSQQAFSDASVDASDTTRLSGGSSGGRTQGSGSGAPLGSDPRLTGCDLRASLAGYRSEVVSLGGRRVLDDPDVGTIILHRLGNVEGATISATSLAAPKDAKKAYEKGVDSMKKQDWPGAQKQLEKAVNAYPRYAAAWYQLGTVEERQDNVPEARKAFAQAVQADPKYLRPYLPIANLALREKNWQEAADATDKLLRLDPVDLPQALVYNAIANLNLNHLDVAEKSAREAVRIDTHHEFPRAEYVLGFILGRKQDYAAAVPLMKSYVAHDPNASDIEVIRKQIVQMEQTAAAPKQP